MFKKKKSVKKKQTASAGNRNNVAQQRTNRPVSPSGAVRQAAHPSRNKRPPVNPQPQNIPGNASQKQNKKITQKQGKNAPRNQRKNTPENTTQKQGKIAQKKPAFSGQPKPRTMTQNPVQNAKRTSPLKASFPTNSAPKNSHVSPQKSMPKKAAKISKKSTPKSIRKAAKKSAKKTAPKSAEKTARRTKTSVQSKTRYHGGNYILYYMLAGVIAITVFAILANTVLFKCKTITVSGNLRYTAEEIAGQSMIEIGKNLLHINTRQAEENIVSSLAYIDAAKVKRAFPTGIDITVTEAEKRFYIRQGIITAAVSYGGKIIEHSAPDGLTVFSGYEPESIDVGVRLKSGVDGKNDMPDIILNAIEKASLESVDEVELEDRFSIKMYVDGGRVILELGTIADMESKLMVANELIRNQIAPSERGTVLLWNNEQATFIPEKVSDAVEPDDLNDTDDQSDQDDSSDE